MNQDQGNRIRNMHPPFRFSRLFGSAFTLFHTSWLRIFPGSTNIHSLLLFMDSSYFPRFSKLLLRLVAPAGGKRGRGGGKYCGGRFERKTAICPLHFTNAAGACKVREMIRKLSSSVSSRRFDLVLRETTSTFVSLARGRTSGIIRVDSNY